MIASKQILKSVNPHFIGRDELLDRLDQQLSSGIQEHGTATNRVALTQAIKRLGGIGKTQISVEYAYCSRDLNRYVHTFWVNAASAEVLLTSFVEIAELLPAFSAKGETDQHKLAAAIKHWLVKCKQRWLLIFDNADDVTLVRDYLPNKAMGAFCPPHVLMLLVRWQLLSRWKQWVFSRGLTFSFVERGALSTRLTKRSIRLEILSSHSTIFRWPSIRQEPILKKCNAAWWTISPSTGPIARHCSPSVAWGRGNQLSSFGCDHLVTLVSEGSAGQSCSSRTPSPLLLFGT